MKVRIYKSLIAQLSEELLLIEEAIFIKICLLYELKDVIIADIDIEVLVEDCLDLIDSHQPLLLPIEQCEHVQCFFFPSSAEEPLLGDKFHHFAEGEGLLILMDVGDLVFYLLAVHLGVGEVAEDAAQVLPADVASVCGVVEGEGVFDLVFLG